MTTIMKNSEIEILERVSICNEVLISQFLILKLFQFKIKFNFQCSLVFLFYSFPITVTSF